MGAHVWRKGLEARQQEFEAAQLAYEQAIAAAEMPDLDNPTADELRRMIAELTVRKGREPLAERVDLRLAV
jgi:hypothetical protein